MFMAICGLICCAVPLGLIGLVCSLQVRRKEGRTEGRKEGREGEREVREEGREEGRKEGRKERRKGGRKEGKKEGREEARKEGRKEGRKGGRGKGQINQIKRRKKEVGTIGEEQKKEEANKREIKQAANNE